ncbi:MAG: HPr family phosphocarrier protein [Alphaproteobacteria bacterium]|jgi:phosphocarrier protein|nr:HPr family phosphocarrier protein [Alphaproteobacteria bacterium]
MCANTLTFTLLIQNKKGLHARAASLFVKEADKFLSTVWVEKDKQKVSGRSIMGLMMLAAAKGTEITVTVEGTDAQRMKQALTNLVNDKFYEKE